MASDLSIVTQCHKKFPKLLLFNTYNFEKMYISHVTIVSNGIVIDIDNDKVVSYPYIHIPPYNNRYLFGEKVKL